MHDSLTRGLFASSPYSLVHSSPDQRLARLASDEVPSVSDGLLVAGIYYCRSEERGTLGELAVLAELTGWSRSALLRDSRTAAACAKVRTIVAASAVGFLSSDFLCSRSGR